MRRTPLLAAAFAAALFVAAPTESESCQGTPQPACGRSIWIAKLVDRVVVLPATGDIDVPVVVLPFVTWSPLPCAQPAAATLSVRLICTPVPAGAPVDVGLQVFPVPAPTIPGLQPPVAVTYVIPAGTLPAGTPQICRVIGTYTVTFGAGPGSGPLAATGDTQVCLVEPAPKQPSVPRLDVRLLTPEVDEPFVRCRRGDQTTIFFLISNNDPKQSVMLDLSSTGRQTAVLPDGFDPANAGANFDANVFSISSPTPGTDVFPAQFGDLVAPGTLLPEPDFGDGDTTLTRTTVLPPLGSTIVPITMRSYGMCANGSCSERFLRVDGEFADGTPALGCANTALVVQDVAPKSPLCEIQDFVKVRATVDGFFSPTTLRDSDGLPIRNASTHSVGNMRPGSGEGVHLQGSALATGQPQFHPQAVDSVRISTPPGFFDYMIDATDVQQPTQGTMLNTVQLQVPIATEIVQLGLVGVQGRPTDLLVQLFPDIDLLTVTDRSVPTPVVIYDGSFQEFTSGPPPGFLYDPQTCRAFQKSGDLDAKTIYVDPSSLLRTFTSRDRGPCLEDTVQVRVAGDMSDAPWTGTVMGDGLTLRGTSGVAGIDVIIDTELVAMQLVGNSNVGWLDISCPGALNVPLLAPVVTRVVDVKPKSALKKKFAKPWKNVTAGTTATGTITIQNKGKGPLTFDVMAISGGPFSFANAAVVGRHELGPKQSMVIDLVYAPPLDVAGPAKGRHDGILPIQFCSKDSVTNVKLKGTFRNP